MTALYQLTKELAELEALANTDDASLLQAIQDTMAGIAGEFDQKAESIIKVIRNIDADVTAIDAERERLAELKRIKKNSIDQMRAYLLRNMEAAGRKSIKLPLFTLSVRMGSEKVIINNEDAIPDDYVRVETSVVPDKKAIAEELKRVRDHNAAVQARIDAGEDAVAELLPVPEYAVLERGDSSLTIK